MMISRQRAAWARGSGSQDLSGQIKHPGDQHPVADPQRPVEADHRLVRRAGGDPAALGGTTAPEPQHAANAPSRPSSGGGVMLPTVERALSQNSHELSQSVRGQGGRGDDRWRALPGRVRGGPGPRRTRWRGRRPRVGGGARSGTPLAATPGRVAGGTPARWRPTTTTGTGRDAALMADLGLGAYRFSVAWPRGPARRTRTRQPSGPRLLPAADRQPAGARHRALGHPLPPGPPQALQDSGGRASREVVDRFVDYAAATTGRCRTGWPTGRP